MASSCGARTASSSSLSARRDRWAILRTSCGVRGMAARRMAESRVGRHRERLLLDRPLHPAAADALHAHAQRLHRAADLALDGLQVRPEHALADAGRLAADAAQVLGLAAPGYLI